MYICVFSRSEGAGSATTRNTRGLTRSVSARIVPPLPAVSRPSKTMIDAVALVLDPLLQLAQLGLQLAQLLLVLLVLQTAFGVGHHANLWPRAPRSTHIRRRRRLIALPRAQSAEADQDHRQAGQQQRDRAGAAEERAHAEARVTAQGLDPERRQAVSDLIPGDQIPGRRVGRGRG